MTDPLPDEEATLFPKTAGERLREAREGQGLSLAEIASRTRVPVRQLEAVESGNYGALPSITYSVGFAKAYARAVGLDEAAIARDVRGASDQPATARRTDYEAYEIDEPTRVPTRGLAIGTLIVAVLLLVAGGLYYGTTLFRGEEKAPPPLVTDSVPAAPAPVAAPSPTVPTGQVVLTATDEVWLKVYGKGADGAGKTLYIGTLKAGETFAVPAGATGPLINVGRPDKLQVTVGGTAVAPLGDGRLAIKDVPIDAASLTARGAPQAAASRAAAAPATTGESSAPASRPAPRPTARATQAATPLAPLNIAAPAPVTAEPTAPATTTPNP